MENTLTKVIGSSWIAKKAKEEINNITNDLSSISNAVEGKAKWVFNKLKAKFLGTLLQQANKYQEVDQLGGNDKESAEELEGLMSQGEGESFGFEQLYD